MPTPREAARANARIERRSGVDILDPETRVRPSTSDLGKYRLTITLFCPTRLAEPLEDAITWDILSTAGAGGGRRGGRDGMMPDRLRSALDWVRANVELGGGS